MLHISTSVVEVALDYLLHCVFLICFIVFQIQNFAATTMKYGVLKADVSNFAWIYPTGYPKQKNLYVFNLACPSLSLSPNDCMFTFLLFLFLKRFDCGLYTMDYMDACGVARRWWLHHSNKYVLPFKNFLIATPILSLNMLPQFCSPFFFFHYLSR